MLDILKSKLEKESHRYMVSREMFCPVCNAILDVKTATSITVYNQEKEIVYTKVFCSKHLQSGYKESQAKLCEKNNLIAEIYHGKQSKLEVIGQ